MPRVSDSGHEMVKTGNREYEYRTFTVLGNYNREFGLPESAWVVYYESEPINPIWGLKDAMEYIDEMIQSPRIEEYAHLRTDEEKENLE